jgi:hypothetical protein
VTLCAAPAWAQAPRPERPYRGLFGGGAGEAEQLFAVGGSLGYGYDDDLQANARGISSTATGAERWRGVLASGSAGMSYSLRGERLNLNTSAATSARYYPSAETQIVRGSMGRFSIGTSFSEGTSVSAATAVSYQPYTFSAVFPPVAVSQPVIEVPDLLPIVAVAPDMSYLMVSGDAGISHRLSERAAIGASYGYRATDDAGSTGQFVSQSLGGRFTYQVAKGFGVRAGYQHAQTTYANDVEPVVNHAIDAGVDYGRALSFSRRTSVSFGTGSSATSVDDRMYVRATGSARLNHEIGRTWTASATYARGVTVNESWQEPVFSDSVAGGVGGLITRRLQFQSSVSTSMGTVGVPSNRQRFDSTYGTLALSYAVSRFINTSVTYMYYHHQFDQAIVLPGSAPRTADRQSITANVSLWAPVFHRARRVNATR